MEVVAVGAGEAGSAPLLGGGVSVIRPVDGTVLLGGNSVGASCCFSLGVSGMAEVRGTHRPSFESQTKSSGNV